MKQCNCCGHWLEYDFGIHDGEDWYCSEDCLYSLVEDVWIDEYIDYMIERETP